MRELSMPAQCIKYNNTLYAGRLSQAKKYGVVSCFPKRGAAQDRCCMQHADEMQMKRT
jgi:hypothetical protein